MLAGDLMAFCIIYVLDKTESFKPIFWLMPIRACWCIFERVMRGVRFERTNTYVIGS